MGGSGCGGLACVMRNGHNVVKFAPEFEEQRNKTGNGRNGGG